MEPGTPRIAEVFTYLIVRNAARAIEYYCAVFGAEVRLRIDDGDRVGHAELRFGPAVLMVADEYPELGIVGPETVGGTGTRIHLHVDDVDGLTARAAAAGGTVLRAPRDEAHGERPSRIRDPFGHEWLLGDGGTPGEPELRA